MRFLSKKIGLSLLAMVAIAAALLYWEGTRSSKPWGPGHFPNVVLTTQHGTKVRLYDDLLKGKAVAVNTFFAGCGDVCPLGTAKMLELQKLLGDRVGRTSSSTRSASIRSTTRLRRSRRMPTSSTSGRAGCS
jgi:cytochrome oxidase Cu insertion factor (SCO1/SenC/PrrC family)